MRYWEYITENINNWKFIDKDHPDFEKYKSQLNKWSMDFFVVNDERILYGYGSKKM